ncbi:hypothetical protein MASR2M39_05330 [Ignavibacteriales bacterium]
MMISSSYFVVAGISLGIYSNEWEASKNLLHIFVSGSFFIKWLYLFALGFAATASLMLFKVFLLDGSTEATDEYKEFARELLLKIAMFAAPRYLFDINMFILTIIE